MWYIVYQETRSTPQGRKTYTHSTIDIEDPFTFLSLLYSADGPQHLTNEYTLISFQELTPGLEQVARQCKAISMNLSIQLRKTIAARKGSHD